MSDFSSYGNLWAYMTILIIYTMGSHQSQFLDEKKIWKLLPW